KRIGAALSRYDAVRIDHFRGISSYWSIPAHNKTARCGHWVEGPGMRLIGAIKQAYPDAEFIAEDLGFLTPEVHELVRDSQWPGMKVLLFAFDPSEPSIYLPHKYGENCICYTGTHDNETLLQWAERLTQEEESYTRAYLKISDTDDLPQAIIEAGMQSKANLFIAQMQDYLRLGGDARMNAPGILKQENWCWRMLPKAYDEHLSEQIRNLTVQYDRG
ncbi:MAG: 4-alpha-glucanotransferase, partial [Oscillospiraceae bacterium]|nr:4-alpha-glucanotransferase [Oscillospiraceae bacterium]